MSTYLLREAILADSGTIASLLVACDLSNHGVLLPNTRYWLAEATGAAVGTIGLEFAPEAALLRSAAVLPAWRGRSLGVALVQRALSEAAALVPVVYLFSTDAGPFWQRFGFVAASVGELVAALPQAPQVQRFAELGWLPSEVAWKLQSSAR